MDADLGTSMGTATHYGIGEGFGAALGTGVSLALGTSVSISVALVCPVWVGGGSWPQEPSFWNWRDYWNLLPQVLEASSSYVSGKAGPQQSGSPLGQKRQLTRRQAVRTTGTGGGAGICRPRGTDGGSAVTRCQAEGKPGADLAGAGEELQEQTSYPKDQEA